MIEAVDPFIGTGATHLPSPEGLAAGWWFPKPQVGNTHPGAMSPFGMVSACAYSGAYPTGYGTHKMSTEGLPPTLFDDLTASGFTHFQQSGTGAIRKYYNYFRVTPMLEPLDELGTRWPLTDEEASPGYYGATLGTAIRGEVTVGPKSAIHRYTFPASSDARVVIDFSIGGLAIEHGETVPMRAHLRTSGTSVVRGEIVVEGVPLAVHIECDVPGWRQMLWYDRRLMAGGSRLDFDSIRQTTLRPFGSLVRGRAKEGDVVEVRIGFSLRGVDQAEANLHADLADAKRIVADTSETAVAPVPELADSPPVDPSPFDLIRSATAASWSAMLDTITVEGGTDDQRSIFYTALYHSLVKPCFAEDESPFWPSDGPFVFDICTMWDIYKTPLPLMLMIAPERAEQFATALLQISSEEGNLPIGYRMARGADRFSRQASALAHTFFADALAAGLDLDWEWALVHLTADLRRSYGEDFLTKGVAHPITHTLDLAYGNYCTAKVARALDDEVLAEQLDTFASRWTHAFDPSSGLLIDSTFYEGGRWNYSFRLLHDMASRIELAGGEDEFVGLLDRFFGFGAPPVEQLGLPPFADALEAGYALNRFEGLNNEPDIEVPWAYHYAGRPDRTAEIVHSILTSQFATGRGGLPGNDDSGGLSSWYVWASLGLFPVAGQDLFLVNAPAFERSTVSVGGRKVVIEATVIETTAIETTAIETSGSGGSTFESPGPGSSPQFVVAARLDGRPIDRSWISGAELRATNTISLDLASQPTGWATSTRPPSIATQKPS